MKKGRLYIYAAVFVCGMMGMVSSCSTNDIDSWQSKGFVWFTDTIMDFTNMSQPDVPMGGTLTAAIPLTIASDVADYDRTVNVEVTRQPGDSRTKFNIKNPVVIRAGHTTDTMYVEITNSEHLDVVYDSISFRVIPSDDFEPGLNAYQNMTLALHNGYVRPDWWTSDAEWVLGYFTQLKMQIFVEVTGGMDDPHTGGYWSSSDIALQYWVYLLNDYVEKNDIRYPDDDPNAPGQAPCFDWRSY
ncbi:MAG: DUF4843 domain-containing protein [Prevotella sp.]